MERVTRDTNVSEAIPRAIPELRCFANAVRASMAVFEKTNGAELPRVHRLVLRDMQDSHAYLRVGGKCYSEGVTWPNGRYPELSAEELERAGGSDFTLPVLVQTLIDFEGDKTDDEFGKIVRFIPGGKEAGIKTLKRMIQKLVEK